MQHNLSTEKVKTPLQALFRIKDTRSIMIGVVIGLIIGALLGFVAPSTQIKNLNAEVSDLEALTSQLQQEVGGLQNETSTLQSTLQLRESELETKNSEVNSLNEQVQQLQGQVDQLNSQFTELNESSVQISKYSQLEEEHEELLSTYLIVQADNAKKQAKIQELRSLIQELEDKIDILQEFYNFTPGTWKTIKDWTGSIDKTTELFLIPSNEVQIKWRLEVGTYSSCSIWLYNEQQEYVASWISLHEQPEGVTYAHVTPGYYYLEIDVLNVSYEITLATIFE